MKTLFLRRLKRFLRSGSFHAPEYRKYLTALNKAPETRLGPAMNLTIDFELAWSRARRGDGCTTKEESLQRSQFAREALPILLELADEFKIPITFAVVGHVALSSCEEHREPPLFSPSWAGDWFALDPKTNSKENLDFYGIDVVQQILGSRTKHEIGSHGFSHVDLGDDQTDVSIAHFEVFESHDVLKRIWPEISTFVFPKNHPGYISLLKDAGFKTYRTNQQHPLHRDEYGLWKFPLGLWLSPLAASPQEITTILDYAVKRKTLVNFWCHLYEFETREQVYAYFRPLFRAAHTLRESGLAIATMQDMIRNIQKI
jgi:peptidoglycan/xylan/chitin deacetylase (PgdA/CDA1 family)